jgi:PHD/YefM family antitoxin component YafN of YafNO toxin-antitoxin module
MPEGPMNIASVKEVKDKLAQFLKTAKKEDVIITKNGRPRAVLHHLGEDEIEDYLLEHLLSFARKSRDDEKKIFRRVAVPLKRYCQIGENR